MGALIQGDPKTKFLRLFLSTVRRPTICPTIKNFSWHCPCPTSDLRPGANPIKWGQSYTDLWLVGRTASTPTPTPNPTPSYTPHQGAPSGGRRAEGGGRTTKGKGGRRTADGRKFLLLLSYTRWYRVDECLVGSSHSTQRMCKYYVYLPFKNSFKGIPYVLRFQKSTYYTYNFTYTCLYL